MDDYDILIVGGGQAARRAAEGVRSVSPDLTVAIVGEEIHPPYDRPPLSKEALIQGDAGCPAKPASAYAEAGVDLILGQRVEAIDRDLRQIRLGDGRRHGYGRLILATGSRVRTLQTPFDVKDRVTTLRTREDAARLASALRPGARIAIIGAGFIGLEVATSVLARGAVPVVVEGAPRILGRALPASVADRLLRRHQDAGVVFHLDAPVTDIRLAGDGSVVVSTVRGPIVADHVVVGIGVTPNTELAREAGLEADGGVQVDAFGATSAEAIYGAGEVTRHPVHGHDEPLRLESWQVAELQAEAAGRTAAGAPSEHREPPWFWSDQAGVNLQVLGRLSEEALIARDHEDGSSAFFSLDPAGCLQGLITIDRGADVSIGRRLLSRRIVLDPSALADPAMPLRRMLS